MTVTNARLDFRAAPNERVRGDTVSVTDTRILEQQVKAIQGTSFLEDTAPLVEDK